MATLVQLALVTALVDARRHRPPAPRRGGGQPSCSALEAWWLGRSVHGEEDATPTGRPFAIVPALVLAAIISAVLPLALWLQDRYGAAGALAASATAALADVHGASVAMATLVHSGDIGLATAVAAIGAGLATNTLGKVRGGRGGWRVPLRRRPAAVPAAGRWPWWALALALA